MPDPVILSVGDRIGGCEIIAKLHYKRYRIRHLCCGKEGQMTHPALLGRHRSGIDQCMRCAALDRESSLIRARKLRALLAIPGVMDTRGQFWPKLGPMGPRFGYSGHGRCAHGA
jgi:hypothetical protein